MIKDRRDCSSSCLMYPNWERSIDKWSGDREQEKQDIEEASIANLKEHILRVKSKQDNGWKIVIMIK